MRQVIVKDVIQITDRDILNAMAFSLYKLDYEDILKQNNLEFEDVCQELMNAVENPTRIEFYLMGAWAMNTTNIEIACAKFNSFKTSMYITDKFLVTETFNKYFKLGLLNEHDKNEFKRVGKLKEILGFLNDLLLPYEWEYEKFFRLGCSFNKNIKLC